MGFWGLSWKVLLRGLFLSSSLMLFQRWGPEFEWVSEWVSCLTTPGLSKDIRRHTRLLYSHQVTRIWEYSVSILFTSSRFVLGSVAVSDVSVNVLPYVSVAIKARFLKLGMCNICKNNIAKMFLDFFII